MKKIAAILLIGVSTLFFTACGGGSDSGGYTPPPTPVTYNIRALEKSTIEMVLEGTNFGTPFEGTSFSRYIGDITLDGVILNIRENIMTLGGQSAPSYSGFYQGSLHGIEGTARNCHIPEGTVLTPSPESVSIGYVSDMTTLLCDDGAVVELQKRLESAEGNNAYVVGTGRIYTNGTVVVTEDRTTITPNMEIVAYEGSINGGGVNVDMHATYISVY